MLISSTRTTYFRSPIEQRNRVKRITVTVGRGAVRRTKNTPKMAVPTPVARNRRTVMTVRI